MVAAMNALSSIDEAPLFQDVGPRRRQRLRQVANLMKLRKGEFVYLPGDAGDSVYIVADGCVKIAKLSESGKELTLSFNSSGDLFGELALLSDQPRRTMAVALVRSLVWAVPKEEIFQIASSSPAFSLRLSSVIGQRRHDLENRMENLVFRDVPARLAAQLLRLAEQYGRKVDGQVEIGFKLSQLELANLIGATRETTSTAINDMKRAGILDSSHRTIIIRNIDALRDMRDAL